MSYNKMLQKIVYSRDYTQKELAKMCNDLGVKVTRSYINKLLNNKLPPPKDEISRAIAKIYNVDERLLVLEGYIDNAPKEIKEALYTLKYFQDVITINSIENTIDNKILSEIQEQLKQETLADYLINIIDNGNFIVNMKELGVEIKAEDENFILNIGNDILFEVPDNAMYPLIKQNDKIRIKVCNRYFNGDILLVQINNITIIRQAVFLGNTIELIPLNKTYEIKSYRKNDIIILGKVTQIVTNI